MQDLLKFIIVMFLSHVLICIHKFCQAVYDNTDTPSFDLFQFLLVFLQFLLHCILYTVTKVVVGCPLFLCCFYQLYDRFFDCHSFVSVLSISRFIVPQSSFMSWLTSSVCYKPLLWTGPLLFPAAAAGHTMSSSLQWLSCWLLHISYNTTLLWCLLSVWSHRNSYTSSLISSQSASCQKPHASQAKPACVDSASLPQSTQWQFSCNSSAQLFVNFSILRYSTGFLQF